jgi:septal ring factor EnvC (AmiA/AmiB activator)
VLLSLLGLLNKRIFVYFLLASLIVGSFVYQKLKIEQLEKEISQIKLQLQQKQNYLKICKSNIKTLEENTLSKDAVIKQLQEEIKAQKTTCQNLLQKKEKLIANLQKLKMTKPKPIKPTVIIKKNCKFHIETGEQLYEKDFIFDVLSNIGK